MKRTLPTRRTVLAGLGAIGLPAPLPAGTPDYAEELFSMVRTYAQMGVHQTGGAADRETSDWQQHWLEGHGFNVSRHDVPVTGPLYDRCVLEADGRMVEAVAQWPSPAGEYFIEGGPGTAFALAAVSGNTIDTADNLAALRTAFETAPKAVLAVCAHPSGRLQIGNVSEKLSAFPVPVILVGADDRDRLARAQTITLALKARTTTRTGVSLLGVHKQARADKWLIVSTPQSGWTRCGGERGPGIALFRSLAARLAGRLAQSGAPAHLCFVSTSGHEFHNLGARLLHDEKALPAPENTIGWIHLGAGLANRAYTKTPGRFRVHDRPGQGYAMVPTAMKTSLQQSFDPAPILSVAYDELLVGEIKEVVGLGYQRAIGLVAEHPLHHVPGDDETMTSPALLSLYDQAVTRLAYAVMRS